MDRLLKLSLFRSYKKADVLLGEFDSKRITWFLSSADIYVLKKMRMCRSWLWHHVFFQ